MNMLDTHNIAKQKSIPIYHEFLLSFNPQKRFIYGFVEGKDDPSYYRSFIEGCIPSNWDVKLLPSGNKDNVISIYNDFNWNRFSKLQILFFLDRDLSIFLNEVLPEDINVFVTDSYSIENQITNFHTFERVLLEVFNLDQNMLSDSNKTKLEIMFNEQLSIFKKHLINVMSWIIFWKVNGFKPCLNDILMKHLFIIDKGKVLPVNNPKNYNSVDEYIHNQCNIPFNKNTDISSMKNIFLEMNGFENFIRGKYIMWFFVEFCNSVFDSIDHILEIPKIKTKKKVGLGHKNSIVLLAPRVRVLDKIRNFLKHNAIMFIESFEN